MRVVVVGAGVVGLLTAIECVHGGSRVTVLEQGDIPYAWAASHDRHRVIRALHRGDAALTRAATVAYRHWAEFERRPGDRVVLASGPWSRTLVPGAVRTGLTLYRQSTLSCTPWGPRGSWAATPAIPELGTPQGAWLVPPVAGTPLRLSAHSACRAVAEV